MLRFVRDEAVYEVWRALGELGLGDAGADEITDVVSCPGTDSCKLGITSSMGLNQAVHERLVSMNIDDEWTRRIHVKMSGCPNGCSQHHIADIGFYGASIKVGEHTLPAYVAHIGGGYESGDVRYGQRLKVRLAAKRVPDAVERWVRHYESDRAAGESFAQFVQRVGPASLRGARAGPRDADPVQRGQHTTTSSTGPVLRRSRSSAARASARYERCRGEPSANRPGTPASPASVSTGEGSATSRAHATCSRRRSYMAALRLRGRRCLVVGGGGLALEKTCGLVDCGARVTLIAVGAGARARRACPERNDRLGGGGIPTTRDLDGFLLVIAAADDPELQYRDLRGGGGPLDARQRRRRAVAVQLHPSGRQPRGPARDRDLDLGRLADARREDET